MIDDALWEAYKRYDSKTYQPAKTLFEDAGYPNAEQVLREIWDYDRKNYSDLSISSTGERTERVEYLMDTYGVDDEDILLNMGEAVVVANDMAHKMDKLLKALGSCDWHIRRATTQIEREMWEDLKDDIEPSVNYAWEALQQWALNSAQFEGTWWDYKLGTEEIEKAMRSYK